MSRFMLVRTISYFIGINYNNTYIEYHKLYLINWQCFDKSNTCPTSIHHTNFNCVLYFNVHSFATCIHNINMLQDEEMKEYLHLQISTQTTTLKATSVSPLSTILFSVEPLLHVFCAMHCGSIKLK